MIRAWILLLAIAAAQVPSGAGPGVRNAHAMVFDERRARVVLFGGADESSVRADTWYWDGDAWEPTALAGPSPRTFPAFVWDAARGEAVLFGGRRVLFGGPTDRDTFLSDTWSLTPDGWRRREVAGPAPRAEAGIAFDRRRGVVVLFGGYHDVGNGVVRLGDTWEWSGREWRLTAETGPAPRSGMAMTYDEVRERVLLFGGSNGPRADTWTWDGARWEQLSLPPAPGRFNSVAQFDGARREVVRTAGWNGKERVSETWLFRGSAWLRASAPGPSARNHTAITYDRVRQRIVLFGGHDGTFVFGDTWEWDGEWWLQRQAVKPVRRLPNLH